jgi:PIN domain nuclease of toxin-antitoxin system
VTVVLDTCALLFWTHEPQRLTPLAAKTLDALGEERRGRVSAATFWEIALKDRAGRLDLGMTPGEYLARVRRLPVDVEPVDARLWIESVRLEWEHRDPVDRLVVALARRHGAPLVTADRAMRKWHPASVW